MLVAKLQVSHLLSETGKIHFRWQARGKVLSKQNSKLNIGISLSVDVPNWAFDSWFICVNWLFLKKKKYNYMHVHTYTYVYICIYIDISCLWYHIIVAKTFLGSVEN